MLLLAVGMLLISPSVRTVETIVSGRANLLCAPVILTAQLSGEDLPDSAFFPQCLTPLRFVCALPQSLIVHLNRYDIRLKAQFDS